MILRRVGNFLDRHRLVAPGDLVVAGVSGGPDSMFLLAALHRLLPPRGCRLHVAHLDHGLRGAESAGDADFVACACSSLGIPCTVERRPVPVERGSSPQDRARRVRLSFFREIRLRQGAASVALGHTADDQAETLLMRLVAGGGPGGLAGIRPRGPEGIIHPLLEVERRDILAFLGDEGIPFRTDSSNDSDRYLRNRVRRGLIALAREVNPSFPRRAVEVGRLLAEDDALLSHRASSFLRRNRREEGGGLSLRAEPLSRLPAPLARRVLVQAARQAGSPARQLGIRQVETLEDLLAGHAGREATLPGGVTAVRTARAVSFRKGAEVQSTTFEHGVALPGETPIPELGATILAARVPSPGAGAPGSGPWLAYLDADSLAGGLTVRTRRPGDRFVPLGLGRQRKLQDVLTDRKVPRGERERLPVVCDREKIVWVAGLGVDHRARITARTREAVRLEVASPGEAAG